MAQKRLIILQNIVHYRAAEQHSSTIEIIGDSDDAWQLKASHNFPGTSPDSAATQTHHAKL